MPIAFHSEKTQDDLHDILNPPKYAQLVEHSYIILQLCPVSLPRHDLTSLPATHHNGLQDLLLELEGNLV